MSSFVKELEPTSLFRLTTILKILSHGVGCSQEEIPIIQKMIKEELSQLKRDELQSLAYIMTGFIIGKRGTRVEMCVGTAPGEGEAGINLTKRPVESVTAKDLSILPTAEDLVMEEVE